MRAEMVQRTTAHWTHGQLAVIVTFKLVDGSGAKAITLSIDNARRESAVHTNAAVALLRT